MATLAEQLAAARPQATTAEAELADIAPVLAEAIVDRSEYVEAVVAYDAHRDVIAALEADGFRVACSVEPGKVARLYIAGWNEPPAPPSEPVPEPAPVVEEVV